MKTNVQETSLFTYNREVRPTLGERQKAVFRELEKSGAMTNSELADSLNWPINTVTPRVYELRGLDLVVEDEVRTCRVTGRKVIAWRIK